MEKKQYYKTTMMVADKPFRYGTRRLLAGDTFEARSKDVLILEALKRARAERDHADIPEIPEELKRKIAKPAESLLGSSLLNAVYNIGDQQVQLGKIVASAHAESGLTVDEWNALPTDAREQLLAAQLKKFQDEAAPEQEAENEEEEEEEKDEFEKELGAPLASEKSPEELIAEARARYKEIVGRPAYNGWDVAKIEENIAVFQAKQS